MKRAALCLVMISASIGFASFARAERVENPIAIFNGLDKITGITTRFEVKVKEEATFGGLRVKPFVCYTRPVTEAPKTTSFVQVEELPAETKVGTATITGGKRIFSGWMFAESPGLNAVEHPIFDVWLVGCLDPNAPPPPVETPLVDGKRPGEEQSATESGDLGTETEDVPGGTPKVDEKTGEPVDETGQPADQAPDNKIEPLPEPVPEPETEPDRSEEEQD
jgi:hypothetical protein